MIAHIISDVLNMYNGSSFLNGQEIDMLFSARWYFAVLTNTGALIFILRIFAMEMFV